MGSLVYQHTGAVKRTMLFDDAAPDNFVIRTEVRHADNMREINNMIEDEHKPGQTNKLLARAPLTTYEQSVREQWDDADWKRWLEDPDNRHFRVWKGNL